jgi:hypothetical protein
VTLTAKDVTLSVGRVAIWQVQSLTDEHRCFAGQGPSGVKPLDPAL